MKKRWMVLTVMLLAAALCAFGAAAHAQALDDDAIRQMEYERAVALGFVLETCQENPDEVITYGEFCEAVTTLVERYNPDNLAYWKRVSSAITNRSYNAVKIMARRETALGFLYASLALDCCYETLYDVPGQPELVGIFSETATPSLWPKLSSSLEMFGNVPGRPIETVGSAPIQDTTNAAMWYSILRNSAFTEFTLLEWDEQNNLRIDEDCTRREAMLGLIRLLESAPNLVEGNNYISVYTATEYDKTIITPELLAAPSDLPETTQEKLPSNWRGIGLSHVKAGCVYQEFLETDVAFIADNGMNFIRLAEGPIDRFLQEKKEFEKS